MADPDIGKGQGLPGSSVCFSPVVVNIALFRETPSIVVEIDTPPIGMGKRHPSLQRYMCPHGGHGQYYWVLPVVPYGVVAVWSFASPFALSVRGGFVCS